MKLPKAIEILNNYIGTGPEPEPVDLDTAIALGSEAIKGIMKVRKTLEPYVEALLPGETKE